MYGSIYNITYTFLVAFFWIGSGMLSNGRGAGHQMSVHKYMYMLGWRNGKPGPPWVIDFAANWPKSCSDLLCRKGIRVSILHSYRVLPQLSTLKKYVGYPFTAFLYCFKSERCAHAHAHAHVVSDCTMVSTICTKPIHCRWYRVAVGCVPKIQMEKPKETCNTSGLFVPYLLCGMLTSGIEELQSQDPTTQYWLPLQRWVNFRMLSSQGWITEIFK